MDLPSYLSGSRSLKTFLAGFFVRYVLITNADHDGPYLIVFDPLGCNM
jgi:hypothetical protein